MRKMYHFPLTHSLSLKQLLLYFTMAHQGTPKNYIWEHFHTDGKHFKTNQTHKNTWCLMELKFEVK
jgi:hypothetical protein